ncbi:MAG: class III extradiol dioxygenase subunit B-like domain-containing protein [Mycobacteriales bacterium]
MPVVAAAVCPHPPLLIPEIAAGGSAELDDLRAACVDAVDRLLAAGPDTVLVVGADRDTRRYPASSAGTLAAYGTPQVRVDFGGDGPGDEPGGEPLPLPLLVGGWIVRRSAAGGRVPLTGLTVAGDAPAAECLALGRELAASAGRLALLVMGDGSARGSEHAPAHLHPRAEAYDTIVAGALAGADTASLAALDPDAADEVRAGGRAAWQVLAGAAGGAAWRAELTYRAAPYGVGYFVASWEPVDVA